MFVYLLFYPFEKQSDRKRQRHIEKEIHPPIHSPNVHNSQGWARGPNTSAITHCVLACFYGNWIGNRGEGLKPALHCGMQAS